jgi:hypothetical protein
MRCTGSNESKGIDLAITCVGKARSQQLTQRLLEYLLGEKDQIPKVKLKTKFLLKYCFPLI